jgi:glutamine amidotransferase
VISIVDYGMGNLRSVEKAFQKYSDKVQVITDPSLIKSSDIVVLPGDGAFGMAMEHLRDQGWVDPIKEYIANDGIFVGICVGYQLLFESSEEFGQHQGLGIIPGHVKRFRSETLKVPHMGWNTVSFKKESKFYKDIKDNSYFYFIHTYYPEVNDPEWICGVTEYGVAFSSIVSKGNVFATQFHPEKSHNVGMKIIENIVRSACL